MLVSIYIFLSSHYFYNSLPLSLESLSLERREEKGNAMNREVNNADVTLPSIDSSEWESIKLPDPAFTPYDERKRPLRSLR